VIVLSRQKSRVGISKGTGLATEALSLLILSHETMRNRITKAKPLIVLHDTMQKPDLKGEAFDNKSGDRTKPG